LQGFHAQSGISRRFSDLLHVQEHFLRLLAMEEKRTERSNETFMLMLIDISRLIQWCYTPKTMKKLLKTIHSATRDTDIKGWYNLNKIIGIILY